MKKETPSENNYLDPHMTQRTSACAFVGGVCAYAINTTILLAGSFIVLMYHVFTACVFTVTYLVLEKCALIEK